MPSIGAFVEGYLLVVTAGHCSSMGELPMPKLAALETLIFNGRKVVERIWGKRCVVFEHGPASAEKRAGCCVDHAHMHIVPCGIDILADLHPALCPEEIDGLGALRDAHTAGRGYLYYETPSSKKYIMLADNLPSQYIRQVLAGVLGLPEGEWDWRRHACCGNIRETLRRLEGKQTCFAEGTAAPSCGQPQV